MGRAIKAGDSEALKVMRPVYVEREDGTFVVVGIATETWTGYLAVDMFPEIVVTARRLPFSGRA